MVHLESAGALALGTRLKRLSDYLYQSVQSFYEREGYGFQARWFPILYLLRENTSMSVSLIAQELGQTHSAISQFSKKLEAEDLIETVTDPKDERKRLLQLSKKGRKSFDDLQYFFEELRKSVHDVFDEAGVDFLSAVEKVEHVFQKQGFDQRIQQRISERRRANVEVVPYAAEYRKDFYDLNVEWLEKYFYVEPIDHQVLSDPETYILKPGGQIFFARYQNEVIGTCALLNQGQGSFELTKMAVTSKYQGMRAGKKLAVAAIDAYQQLKDTKQLYLESNSKLKPALNLYESVGFQHQPTASLDSKYKRANVFMVYTP